MKPTLLFFLLLILTQTPSAQQLLYDWHFTAQGEGEDLLLSSTIDSEGHSILVGNFENEITIGEVTYSGEEFAINGMIIKLDPEGEVLWSKVLQVDEFDDVYPFAVALDPSNNIVVAGSHWGRVDADPSDEEQILDSGNDDDIFFARYDTDGNLLFATSVRAGMDIEERVLDMEVDAQGMIYLVGYVDGSVDGNKDDPVLFQFVPDGNGIQTGWNYYLPTTGEQDGMESITLCDEHLYVTGGFTGQVDFAPGDDELILDAGTSQDLFVVKLDLSGNVLWAKNASSQGDEGESIGESIVCDGNGSLYITGDYDGIVDFDPDEGNVLLNGFLQSFVLKISDQGDFQWVWDQNDLFSREVILNAAGSPFIASEESEFINIRKLTPDGDLAWISQLEGESSFDISLRGIDFDLEENLYVGTNFSGTFIYNPETGDTVEAMGEFENDVLYIKFRQDAATNVLNADNLPGLNVYPNPVAETLKLELEYDGNPFSLEIIDVQGRVLYQKNNLKDSSLQIPFPYGQGNYYVRLKNSSYQSVVKLVK